MWLWPSAFTEERFAVSQFKTIKCFYQSGATNCPGLQQQPLPSGPVTSCQIKHAFNTFCNSQASCLMSFLFITVALLLFPQLDKQQMP